MSDFQNGVLHERQRLTNLAIKGEQAAQHVTTEDLNLPRQTVAEYEARRQLWASIRRKLESDEWAKDAGSDTPGLSGASEIIEEFERLWVADNGKLIGGYHDWLLTTLSRALATPTPLNDDRVRERANLAALLICDYLGADQHDSERVSETIFRQFAELAVQLGATPVEVGEKAQRAATKLSDEGCLDLLAIIDREGITNAKGDAFEQARRHIAALIQAEFEVPVQEDKQKEVNNGR